MAGNTIYMQEGSNYIDIHDNEVVNLSVDKGVVSVDKTSLETPQDNNTNDTRQSILDELMAFAENGDWVKGITAGDIKGMLTTVLGMGETPLSDEEEEMSEELWGMLEHGRGDRVKIVCANLVGYFAEKKLFVDNDTPALSVQFFGNKKSIDNINKGKNGRLSKVTPLLDAYAPKMVKKR